VPLFHMMHAVSHSECVCYQPVNCSAHAAPCVLVPFHSRLAHCIRLSAFITVSVGRDEVLLSVSSSQALRGCTLCNTTLY
jgi:hypothetical protein